ncbi:MAG TPA: nucleotide-binding protein [Puia sp.]
MEKTKSYPDTYFSADNIKQVSERYLQPGDQNGELSVYYRIDTGDEAWVFDTEPQFFSEYRKKEHINSIFKKANKHISLTIIYQKNNYTAVTVQAKTRDEIETIFEFFEEKRADSIVKKADIPKDKLIFIGHGRSRQWRDLKDHLTDQHHYKIEAYETGIRTGQSILTILDEMASKSSLAILIMTGEDRDEDGVLKARPNVIHETGLFHGRLGFNKTIILLEEGTEEFSNISGIQQIRYSRGNIKETFGDVLAVLKRELSQDNQNHTN